MKILVGEGSCGIAAGAEKVYSALQKALAGTAHTLGVTGCIGMCYLEPIVDVYPDGGEVIRLVRVKPEDAEKILAFLNDGSEEHIKDLVVSEEDSQFLKKQTRIALRRCGIIDPNEISDFLKNDGYTALKKVLGGMTPEQVIDTVKISGLAGRGGAGFPTWFKWNAARQSAAPASTRTGRAARRGSSAAPAAYTPPSKEARASRPCLTFAPPSRAAASSVTQSISTFVKNSTSRYTTTTAAPSHSVRLSYHGRRGR